MLLVKIGLLKRIFSRKKEGNERILSPEDIECRLAEISSQNQTDYKEELTKAVLLYITIEDMIEKGYTISVQGYKGPWYKRSNITINVENFYKER